MLRTQNSPAQRAARERNWNMFRLRGCLANLQLVAFNNKEETAQPPLDQAIQSLQLAIKNLEKEHG